MATLEDTAFVEAQSRRTAVSAALRRIELDLVSIAVAR